MPSNRTGQIVVFAILFLFFLQALTDFIQSIYAFGLLVTAFTIQLASVLLLFTPLALMFLRKAPTRPWIIGIAGVAILGRLAEPMLDPGTRLVACGLSVGAFMLLFPSVLAGRRPHSTMGWPVAWGLLLAVMMSVLFRTAGSSLDISEYGVYQVVAWVLAVLAGWLIWAWELELERTSPAGKPQPQVVEAPKLPATHEERRQQSLQALEQRSASKTAAPLANDGRPPNGGGATGRVIGLCIGLAAVVVMLYFGFASPTVIARWTEAPYPVITGVLVVALGVAIALSMCPSFLKRLSRPFVLTWNALFILMLTLSILPHQVAFPANVTGYPLDAPVASALAVIPLLVTLMLCPIVFIDLLLYVKALSADADSSDGPSIRQLGGGFALSALFVLVMVFLHVFTTIYDYAAPVGPLFRDRFWLVYLISGLATALPLLLLKGDAFAGVAPVQPSRLPAWVAAALAVLTGVALILTEPRPVPIAEPDGTLRVMTYNIQQGFDRVGAADLTGQLAAIRRVAPDVLGLEESDTARIANGNVDAARFFANNLGMYSYYGPTTTVGTFGIALLSRYPIQNPRTFFMYSSGEQTACIQAEIMAGGKTYNIFVTHLGNDGPMIQLQNVMSRVNALPNVVLMGDMNFGPRTPQYALATQSLKDAWLLRWPGGKEIWQQGGEDRIDQIFVSPGTSITESEYVPDPASDHPYLYAVVKTGN